MTTSAKTFQAIESLLPENAVKDATQVNGKCDNQDRQVMRGICDVVPHFLLWLGLIVHQSVKPFSCSTSFCMVITV